MRGLAERRRQRAAAAFVLPAPALLVPPAGLFRTSHGGEGQFQRFFARQRRPVGASRQLAAPVPASPEATPGRWISHLQEDRREFHPFSAGPGHTAPSAPEEPGSAQMCRRWASPQRSPFDLFVR